MFIFKRKLKKKSLYFQKIFRLYNIKTRVYKEKTIKTIFDTINKKGLVNS